MNYFKNLLGSFTTPHTYREFIAGPTRRAFGHFLLSMLIIGAAEGLYLSLKTLPKLHEKLVASMDTIVAAYPADLTIEWDGQQLTTHPAKYRVLELEPSQLPLFASLPDNQEKLVYINDDLTTSSAAEALNQYDAVGIVDQHSLFFNSPEKGMEEITLADSFGDVQVALQKKMLPQLETAGVQIIDHLQPIVLWAAPVALALLLLISQLFTSLFYATLLWLPARLSGSIRTWGDSWRFTLVLLVVAEIISLVAALLYPTLNFPVYAVAFWVLSAFILLSLRWQKAPPVISSKTKS